MMTTGMDDHQDGGGGGRRRRRGENKDEMGTELEGLHEDILGEILSWLDVTNLRQCRLVCKRWKEIICSPGFLDIHRERSMLRNFLLFTSRGADSLGGARGRAPRYWTNIMMTDYHGNHIVSTTRIPGHSRVIPASCDLLCATSLVDGKFYLCNPRTGQILALPRAPYILSCVVFGYLDSRRAYILVGCFRVEENKKGAITFSFPRDGSSSSSSSWKEIKKICPRWPVEEGVLINNSTYWLIGGHDRSGDELIVRLNLENDEFGIINFPEISSLRSKFHFHRGLLCLIKLIDVKGTLCLANIEVLERSNVLELWAFKSNSSSSSCSWVKECEIKLDSPPHCRRVSVARCGVKSSGDGELLASGTGRHDCRYYSLINPQTKKYTERTAHRWPPCGKGVQLLGFCWESLCWPSL